MSEKLLFACSLGRNRSPTAARIFELAPGLQTRFGGLDWGPERDVTLEDLTWADHVFVMEQRHRVMLGRKFGPALRGRKAILLGVPDRFDPMERELVELLLHKVPQFLSTSVDVKALVQLLELNQLLTAPSPCGSSCW